MHAQNSASDPGGHRKEIEDSLQLPPHLLASAVGHHASALGLEAVASALSPAPSHLLTRAISWLPRSRKTYVGYAICNCDRDGGHLVGEEQHHTLQGHCPTVHIVAQEEEAALRGTPEEEEDVDEIVELSVDVPHHRHWRYYLLSLSLLKRRQKAPREGPPPSPAPPSRHSSLAAARPRCRQLDAPAPSPRSPHEPRVGAVRRSVCRGT